jgi:hypothetical protein
VMSQPSKLGIDRLDKCGGRGGIAISRLRDQP